MGQRHLVSAPARVETCPSCRRMVLAGMDEGLVVRADPANLNAYGELAALARGLWTYDYGPARELWLRTVHTIKLRRHPVLADHVCGAAMVPAAHRGPGPTPRFMPSNPVDPPY